jgi:hypothetical protein
MPSGRIPYRERRVFRLEPGRQVDPKIDRPQPAWLITVYRNRKLMASRFLCWRTAEVTASIERNQLLLETVMTRHGNKLTNDDEWEYSMDRMCVELVKIIQADLPGTALTAFEQFERKKERMEELRRRAKEELQAERDGWQAKRLGRGKHRGSISIYKKDNRK